MADKRLSILPLFFLIFFLVLPASSTHAFYSGFETGDFSDFDGSAFFANCTLKVNTTQPYSGVYHAIANLSGDGSDSAFPYWDIDPVSKLYAQGVFMLKESLMDSANERYTVIEFSGSVGEVAELRIREGFGGYPDPEVLLGYVDGAGYSFTGANLPFNWTLNKWYRIELFCEIDSINGKVSAFIDGVEHISITGLNNVGGVSIDHVEMGAEISVFDTPHVLYFDNLQLSDIYIGLGLGNSQDLQIALGLGLIAFIVSMLALALSLGGKRRK